MFKVFRTAFCVIAAVILTQTAAEAKAPSLPGEPRCQFNYSSEQYAGSPVEQARCLLPAFAEPRNRRDKDGGHTRKTLGPFLEALIGQPVEVDQDKLTAALLKMGVTKAFINLNGGLSRDAKRTTARYFVIHDTSVNYELRNFPSSNAKAMVALGSKWPKTGYWRAHAWVNRLGSARITYDFSTPIPHAATRFERDHAGLLGLYIHTEVTQPRRSAPKTKPGDDSVIPEPAFEDDQYRSLALLYVLASYRAHVWMIPAYHVAVDAGVSEGAHDDPAQFDLEKWSSALERWTRVLKP